MNIVGFNLSHDSSVCVLVDGVVTGALALERITRVKRGTVPAHSYAAAMAELTAQVLASADLDISDVDHWIASSTETLYPHEEDTLLRSLGLLVPPGRRLVLPHPGHHLAHACAAFYTSGFDEAVAVVVDAYGGRYGGRRERETIFQFRTGIEPKVILQNFREDARIAGELSDGKFVLPETLSGLGELYRVVTLALGFSEKGTKYDDAGKTMGLASYGKRFSATPMFIEFADGELRFEKAMRSLIEMGLVARDDGRLILQPRARSKELQSWHQDLAAQIQSEFEDGCLSFVHDAVSKTGCKSIVLSGGCFLNSVTNSRIATELDLERVFIFPAATDDGNAVGAAMYAHHILLRKDGRSSPYTGGLSNIYWGPSRLKNASLPEIGDKWKCKSFVHPSERSMAKEAAKALRDGAIVGWFMDRSEFGPRALGARSILCHPGLPGMKDKLNARVKFREGFRPFAAAVLLEHAPEWFEMPVPGSPFMLNVCRALPASAAKISEVVHVDGSCRLQTVADDATAFRYLLEEFREITGIPLILNTSFNLRGMPIVETIDDAFNCLYGSRLDELFIGTTQIASPDWERLVPVRTAPVVASASISGTERQFLELADGLRSVSDIAGLLDLSSSQAIDAALVLRWQRMLEWRGIPLPQALLLPRAQYAPTDE
ncbi:hypothetical protein HFN86_34490 [Rhizobium laguerreae]|uniref:carbamoyltransferase C-terminal domain-containing protein n=1 Tax=Rhizobium laguerreae TaxID=1076926 RepID=UPI001C9089A1|nr:carbamoyltransferase C-terminal domain-containing protein [Rhizobium laguerreae]MBY3425246.1 hypothetical protein [Rhizobium laguerreae]